MKTAIFNKKQAFLAIFLFFGIESYATIRYVKPTATGTGDGSTWANASADIQAMIVASVSGDEVWVAAGVYYPQKDAFGNASPVNAATKTFLLKSGVKIYGGFVGTETLLSQRNFSLNRSILSADLDQNDTNTDGNFIAESATHIVGTNAMHVIVAVDDNTTTRLDGLIITAANGVAGSSYQEIEGTWVYYGYGGGIALYNSFPTITNSVIAGNSSDYGGGIYFRGNGSATILPCTNLIVTGNSATFGGGFRSEDKVDLTNCLFTNNTASYGAGLYMNKTTNFINTTVAKNAASGGNGGIDVGGNNPISFKNTIVSLNTAPFDPNFNFSVPTTVSSTYSMLQGSITNTWNNIYGTDGGGNIDQLPSFLNDADVDGADNLYFTQDDGFTLKNCSMAINSASNALAPATDIIGSIRPYNAGIADMGAYEFQGAADVKPVPTGLYVSNTEICTNSSVNLSATCSVGTPEWFNGSSSVATGITFNPSFTFYNTTFTVRCNDGLCPSASILIPTIKVISSPSVSVNTTNICTGGSVTVTGACNVGTLTWWNASSGGINYGTGSPLVVTPSANGRIYGQCTLTSPSCTSSRGFTSSVTINPIPTNPTAVSVNKTIVCPSTNISLSATCATGTITWYNTASSGTALGTGNGLSQAPIVTTTYYAACETTHCKSARIATSQVIVTTIGSNLNLTTNLSGTSVQASANTIVATNTILSGANVKYLANNSITLNPQSGGGFQVANGAVFEAKILPLVSCN